MQALYPAVEGGGGGLFMLCRDTESAEKKRVCSTHSLLLGSDFQDAKRKKAKEWVSNNGTWCGGMGRGCRGEIESICDCGRN